MPPKVATVPRQVPEPGRYATGVAVQNICAMPRSDKWCALQSRDRQLLFIDNCLKNECGIALAAVAIGDTFVIEGSHARKIRSKAHIKPKAAHRPLALTEDEEAAVVPLIREGDGSGNDVTRRGVLNFVGE